ncbi:MAG: type II toxin-antitoxin system VapC family toxin [Tessaracoccus sp.]|uniref:type II toxin-antitoxin system VapC family toxin n=1 Tax=Tessaracoccus sp. TaxID=1971211 RepID=UPI001EB38BAA|nr:type II toxin-antitoxin system VapC family toxin [Tessaracoccus sp.]MBK7821973.1 type II toxin-antitoxin system VapC family toxin [Tessaracoccus sp.]
MSAVIDASALLEVVLDPNAGALAGRLVGEDLHAPAHVRVEAMNVLRRQRNAGLLSPAQAETAVAAVMAAPLRLWPFESVADRAWGLGENATTYDAAYLALAERLAAPLITHDAKLPRVPGARCAVEVF